MKKFFLLILLLLISCLPKNKQKLTNTDDSKPKFDCSKFNLKVGDILFQDSDCGPFCESIEKVTFGVNGAKFSHVGLVITDDANKLIVIEAVSKGVVKTSLDDFFNRSFDEKNRSKVVVGRIKNEYQELIPKAVNFTKSNLGLAYDEVFDITHNKYYCSELIYDSFKYANNNTPIFQLKPMTYKDPETNATFRIWEDYFKKLNIEIPEGKLGLNPGGMSKSKFIEIVYFYGKPQGYVGKEI